MRDETKSWLSVLEDAAKQRGIDTEPLRDQAFPQSESPVHDLFVKHVRESDRPSRRLNSYQPGPYSPWGRADFGLFTAGELLRALVRNTEGRADITDRTLRGAD
jgi:hypothetical protein